MLLKPAANGYRSLVVPRGLLDVTGCAEAPTQPAFALINADRDTLIWSQRIESGETSVFKMYRHRGPISWWREKHFRFRVQREFDMLKLLERREIPCSRPLFWSWDCCERHGQYEVLATKEIPDAVPLDIALRSREHGNTALDLHALFEIIARMHRAGLHHGALYTRNVLVTGIASGDTRFHIIDVPKAIAFPSTIAGTRMARIDLLDLSQDLAGYIGLPQCIPLFRHYGLDGPAAYEFMDQVARFRPSKHTRNRNRAECEIRELAARLRPFRRANHLPMPGKAFQPQ